MKEEAREEGEEGNGIHAPRRVGLVWRLHRVSHMTYACALKGRYACHPWLTMDVNAQTRFSLRRVCLAARTN